MNTTDLTHVPNETPYLDGIVVLDFTQYLAGPACTRLLAEMGAQVIKIEFPPYGDPTRSSPPRKDRRSYYLVQQNRGKRSLCVDLGTEEGVDIIRELVERADIVVENFSPGVMARRGLSYEDLRAINPRIIMCSVSGFGQTGPMASKSAFDFIAQGYSGMAYMTGEPDGPPLLMGIGVVDVASGVHAWGAIGHALFRRDRTGEGAHLDIAMVDAAYHMQETAVGGPSLDASHRPTRTGRMYGPISPAGIFKGPEGWITIFAAQNQIGGLWAALGRPELDDDPRFKTNPTRLENRDALTGIIEGWMADHETDREVIEALEAHRVPCGQVVKPWELADVDPHFVERGTVRVVDDPHTGPITVPGFPIRFSDAPDLPDLVASDLGEDNAWVLGEFLSHDDETIARLERDGVLFRKTRA